MSLTDEHQKQLEVAVSVIKEHFPSVLAIYLFGSFGTEYQRNDSDLDLAVYVPDSPSPVDLWEVAEKVASKIGRDVQIVDLRGASTVFRHEIISAQQRLFCRDSQECDRLENLYDSMYLRFNEERKDLLEDFGKRKEATDG